MLGAIPLLDTPPWYGAQLKRKHRDNFTFKPLNMAMKSTPCKKKSKPMSCKCAPMEMF
jgi:hypothetical protein